MGKRFTCTECSQERENGESSSSAESVAFATYALLQAHVKAVHPPQCPECLLTCATSRELRRHLEIAHGHVDVEQRKVFPCTVPGCDRSFTKKGNLNVHVRTVHEGERRFVCGETDLSTSRKAEGYTGEGCGKRYGSKLALEEHVRTSHLGHQNAKAERRQRLGLASKGRGKGMNEAGGGRNRGHGNLQSQNQQTSSVSTLAALTGQGYAEETGRKIACFYETCAHRFHRDYDLWVHMGSKHGCSEDETQGLFLRRALLEASNADAEGEMNSHDHDDLLGVYAIDAPTLVDQEQGDIDGGMDLVDPLLVA